MKARIETLKKVISMIETEEEDRIMSISYGDSSITLDSREAGYIYIALESALDVYADILEINEEVTGWQAIHINENHNENPNTLNCPICQEAK